MAHKSSKGIEYYLGLEYPYSVVSDEDEFFVQFPDLPGCLTQVERSEDIHAMAQEVKELWLETALEAGQHIPEPMSDAFSGKFLTRVPKSLHQDLALRAKEEGISLNSLVNYLLSSGLAIQHGESSKPGSDRVREARSSNEIKAIYSFVVPDRGDIIDLPTKMLSKAQ